MNGTHRKVSQDIPGTHEMARHAVAMVALTAALAVLVTAVALIVSALTPSNASVPAPAWQTVTQSMLVHDATLANPRPYWDGRHPRIWTANHPAMCSPKFSHRHGWARGDANSPVFPVECLPLGPSEWAWSEIQN